MPGPNAKPKQGPIANSYDAYVREEQKKRPLWKQYAGQAIDAIANVPKGLLGIDPASDESTGGYIANALMQLGDSASSGVAKAVSMFGSKSLREAATRAFRETGAGMPTNIKTAMGEFADRYPRVAAHIKPGVSESSIPGAHAFAAVPTGQVKEPVPVNWTPEGIDKSRLYLDSARDSMFHEGAHVAQALGNRNMAEMYRDATDIAGYKNNPFEINARASGARNYPGSPRTTQQTVNINDKLNTLSRNTLDRSSVMRFEEKAARRLQSNLARRGVIQHAYDPDEGLARQLRALEAAYGK